MYIFIAYAERSRVSLACGFAHVSAARRSTEHYLLALFSFEVPLQPACLVSCHFLVLKSTDKKA